ncbi:MAG TPA: hypothetical protein VLZ05_03325 [Mycobacterium sp.]|nr:hypothetical protein [Mycobacterium sp.]HUH67976.1 hypothetical protein [Mycobacterium sp.]
MTTTTPQHQCHESHAAGARRRQLRILQLIFAGAAAIAMLALFDAARPDTTGTMLGSGSVRLTDMAVDLPAPASGPFGQIPRTPPNLSGGGGFAADDDNDQAQQQEQQALQQMQESEQQAEEQNEEAEQQFEEGMQQAQVDEQQANDP